MDANHGWVERWFNAVWAKSNEAQLRALAAEPCSFIYLAGNRIRSVMMIICQCCRYGTSAFVMQSFSSKISFNKGKKRSCCISAVRITPEVGKSA